MNSCFKGFCPDPVGLQPIPVNQAPVYPYAQQQYNPYTTEGFNFIMFSLNCLWSI